MRTIGAPPSAVRGPERGAVIVAPPRPRPRARRRGPREPPGCKQACQLTRPDCAVIPAISATSRALRCDRAAAAAAAMQPPSLLLLVLGLLAAPAAALVR